MDQESTLSSALEGAFAPAAPAPKVDVPEPAAAPEPTEPADAAPEGGEEAAPADPAAQPAAPEPEFEYEFGGKREKIVGREAIQAELAKARDYSQKTEQIARVREALLANAQAQDVNGRFQQAIVADIADLRAMDSRLEQFAKVDWNTLIDTNFTEALKLQEQRNQLTQLRNAKLGEIQTKQQQFQQGQAQAAQQLLATEGQALLAKLPEWRNSEKAGAEQKALQSYLRDQGFDAREIDGLTDHRAVIVARKAWLYDQLMANKGQRVQQAREAPPMVRPGAAPPKPDGRAEFAKARAKMREFGTKGNHKAQENMALRMFEQAFKPDGTR